ncbi:MAG: type II toxin-antitoxin system VapC family toxin [Nitrososphaerales archaeon]
MRLLLDTSFLIALRKGDHKVAEVFEAKKGEAEDVGISRLSQYELLVGASYLWKKHGDVREYLWMEETLRWLTIYELDGDVVRMAAEAKCEALLRGEDVPDMDLLIALSAKAGSELLTLDEDHARLKGYLNEKGVRVTYLGP